PASSCLCRRSALTSFSLGSGTPPTRIYPLSLHDALPISLSKTGLVGHIAEAAELSKKQVHTVLEELASVIEGHLKKKGGAGHFTMPCLFKIVTKHKPAQKARKGIHPITKEPTTFKAKPASVQVKVRPLKKMKDMAQ